MLIGSRYEDAAGGVFGFGASVEADACTTGDLLEDGQGSLELGALGDGDAIDECGDKFVCVLKCLTDGRQVFSVCSGRARVAVFDRVEGSSYGFCVRRLANEFVISHSFLL